MERIVQICKEYGVPEPEWTATAHDVTVTFWRNSKDAESQNGGDSVGNGGNFGGSSNDIQLTERQKAIYDIIKKNGHVTAKSLSGTLSGTLAGTVRTIERDIKYLRENGLIAKEGKHNNGVWKVLK